jgi:hypothetical protein
MRPIAALAALTLFAACQSAQDPEAPTAPNQPESTDMQQPMNPGLSITINGTALTAQDIQRCEATGVRLAAGSYWYDAKCGAWGMAGGPCAGLVQAGLSLGGPLQASASGGGNGAITGVFINGRELHPADVTALQQLGPVYPGRYWVDAQANFGFENGPPLGNLAMLAQQRQRQGGSSYLKRTHAGYLGGDGETSYFFDPVTGASVIPGEGVQY